MSGVFIDSSPVGINRLVSLTLRFQGMTTRGQRHWILRQCLEHGVEHFKCGIVISRLHRLYRKN